MTGKRVRDGPSRRLVDPGVQLVSVSQRRESTMDVAASRAAVPDQWSLDGFPNGSCITVAIRAATSGATGVLALKSR
jgi:hypothetical protein